MIDAKSIFFFNYDTIHSFKDCTDRRHNCADLCGLLILADLLRSYEYTNILSHVSYDEVYLHGTIDELNEVATEEDILNLMRCGIHYSHYESSLYMLV